MRAVLWPALAKVPARGVPACPEPIIIASYFVVIVLNMQKERLNEAVWFVNGEDEIPSADLERSFVRRGRLEII
jgi:hypothetical protein